MLRIGMVVRGGAAARGKWVELGRPLTAQKRTPTRGLQSSHSRCGASVLQESGRSESRSRWANEGCPRRCVGVPDRRVGKRWKNPFLASIKRW